MDHKYPQGLTNPLSETMAPNITPLGEGVYNITCHGLSHRMTSRDRNESTHMSSDTYKNETRIIADGVATLQIINNRGELWGTLCLNDSCLELSLYFGRLPATAQKVYVFQWRGSQSNHQTYVGPSCTGVLSLVGPGKFVGHFTLPRGFHCEFEGFQSHDVQRHFEDQTCRVTAKIHWDRCFTILQTIANLEKEARTVSTMQISNGTLALGDKFISILNLPDEQKTELSSLSREYYLSTSCSFPLYVFRNSNSAQSRELLRQTPQLVLCRDAEGIMWGSFNIHSMRGVLRLNQPGPTSINSETILFNWRGVSSTGSGDHGVQKSLRTGAGHITFGRLGDSIAHGRFNIDVRQVDTDFCYAGWHEPFEFYLYGKTDSKKRFMPRPLWSFEREWSILGRVCNSSVPKEASMEDESPVLVRLPRRHNRPEGVIGRKRKEALLSDEKAEVRKPSRDHNGRVKRWKSQHTNQIGGQSIVGSTVNGNRTIRRSSRISKPKIR